MGKQNKNRRSKQNRNNPTDAVTVEDPHEELGNNNSTESTIIQQLASSSEEDREVACNAIANIVIDESEKFMEILSVHGDEILKLLLINLCDRSTHVQIAAAGALR
jgi:hypothetical protein